MTLRDAITEANILPGADTIVFSLAVPIIQPLTPLPPITGPTTIDGSNPSGPSSVTIDGTTAGGDGLDLTGGNSVVKNLTVIGFQDGIDVDSTGNLISNDVVSGNSDAGIYVKKDNNTIRGSRIGTDSAGTSPNPNNLYGILIENSGGVTVGGTAAADRNVISGNNVDGIHISGGGSGNVVSGNFIGVDASGEVALANQTNGISVEDSAATTSVVIGGTSTGAGNVISGNAADGVFLSNVANVSILGNLIGTNTGGSAIVANTGNGITINSTADNTAIGSPTSGARNVISGNHGDGITSFASGANNAVQGNYIGTNAAGNAALPNRGNGISVFGDGILIGGNSSSAGNVISGNLGFGMGLFSSGTGVQSNLIGTASDGTTALGNNDNGIDIDGSNNLIGSPTTGNTIAYNSGNGVGVELNPLDVGNAIRGNNIFLNGGLGIDLGNDGVTPNDPQDTDAGPNNFQNFPDLSSVTLSGNTATIKGTLNSTPNSTFVLDFFASQIWDPTHYGEGQKYLGSITVMTDSSGNASFTATMPGVPAGYNYFAATATDSAGNTSEFDYDPEAGVPAPTATHHHHHVHRVYQNHSA